MVKTIREDLAAPPERSIESTREADGESLHRAGERVRVLRLDRELHDRLIAELAEVLRATATTAVLVTHDRDEAATLATRVVQWSDLQSPSRPGTEYPAQPEIS